MFIFNEISSGGPGLFFVVALWTLFRYALQNNLHTSWLHTCCLFFEQLASPIYKKYKVVSKGQFSNSSTGSCLSSVFYPPGLSPLIKSSRPDFHALLSGSVQKAGFLLGILMVLSLANINAATIKSTASGGDWSSKTSWIGGIVPANGDDVSIPAGSTVTIDTNPIVGSLSVSGILQFEVSTARSIIVLTQVTVNSGGVFQSAQTGAVKNHQLIVQGSVINDGKIDFSSNSNATGVELVFTGSGNAIFNCSDAPLTNLKQSNGITLNKGTSAVSVLSFTPGNTFQVLSNGSSSAKGFLSIINGTFNIIGSNSFTNPVFNTEGDYTIPATGGFWLGNQNATVTGINGTVTNLGELKITNGTYRIGISGGKSSGILNIGQFKMSGGNTNIAGKFNVEAGECSISGGEINITTGGYTADNEPTFNVSPQAKLEVYGNPLITIEYPKSVKVPFNDIQILEGSGTKSIRGGTFQLGTANTPFASTFFVNSDIQFYKIAVFNECSLRIVDTSKNQFNSKVNGVFPKLDSENGGLTLTAPENKTVKCNDLIPEPYTSLQSFLNDGGKSLINCTLIAASFKLIGQTQSGTSCPYTITRTYEVADIFGNVETVEHLIVVEGEAVEPQPEALVEPAKEEVLRLKSAMATITSTATGGDWNAGTSWVGGAVPLPGDDVTIVAGATITLTDNRTCNDIAIAGTLAISGTNTLQVNGSLTNSGNISSASGKILLSGNWTNSGTYNGGTNGIVEFTGASNAIISGTTNFEELIINKGNLASTLTINGPTTVLSSGGLTMTSGLVTIPVGGTFTVIPSSGIFIPEIAGFDVTGGTLNTRDFTITNEGLIRISSGTANFGNSSGNSVHTQTDGVFQVSGTSVVNIAGRLENSASGTLTPPGLTSGITISGGTVTLSTVGNGLSSVGSLNVTSAGNFNFTGGTIVFQNESSATTALDLGLTGGTGTKTTIGGTFQFGNASTLPNSVFNISGNIPLNSITSFPNADLKLVTDVVVGQLALNGSSSIDLNGNSIRLTTSAPGTYSFPLDNGSGVSIPVSVTFTSGTFASGAYIELETTGTKHTNNANATNYLNRYWTVTTSGITSPVYDVTATYANADIAGAEAEIATGNWTGSLPWIKGSDVNAGSNTISKTGITSTSFVFTGITSDPPTVVIDNGLVVSICAGSSVTLATTVTGDPTISYLWTPATGLSAANIPNPSANPAASTTYTVTITDGNGFTASDGIDIIVNPIPTVTNSPLTQTICSGGSTTLVTLTSGVAGTTFAWTASATAGVSGFSTSGTGTIPAQTISTTGTTPGTVTYSITPTAAGCSGTIAFYTITVNPIPTVTNSPLIQTICSGGSTTSVALTSDVAGTTFTWTATATPGVSGFTASGTGTIPVQTISTTGTTPGTVTYSITPTAAGCSGTIAFYTITVNSRPVATASPMSQILCSSGTTNIALTSSVAGTTFAWTVVQSGVTGASGGTGNTIAQALSTTGSLAGTVTYSITPSANGCAGSPITVIVTVNPQPTATATPASQTICSAGSTGIVLTSNLPGTTYSWTVSQSGVTGALNGNGAVISQVLSTTGATSGTATYVITPTANGCDGNAITVVVTTSPPPTITLGTIPSTCPGASSFSLPYTSTTENPTTYSISAGVPAVTGFTPVVNATLSGSPLSISLPANVPAGTYQLIISVKNASGCVSTNQTFNVDFVDTTPPVISGCPANITVDTGVGSTTCDKSATWIQPTATDNCIPAASLTWTKNYLPGAIFPVGTTTVTYTVKDLANNAATCSFTVTVIDNTPPTFTPPGAITVYTDASCNVSILPAITGTVTIKSDNCTPAANLVATYSDTAPVAGTCAGTYTITRTWTVTDSSGNLATHNQLITISDNIKPTLNLPLPITIECTASILPANTGQPTGSDNCGGPVMFSYSDVTVAGNCTGRSTITRTWTATDCSGNSSSGIQTINTQDTQAPTLVCTNFTVTTPNDIPASDSYSHLAAVDNCGGPIEFVLIDESYTGLTSGAGFCPTSVIRKYVARDQCGNTTPECTQTIIVSNVSGCAVCQATVPFFPAILDGHPDSLWISPVSNRKDICCGATGPPPPRCISFNVYLDKDAVGLIFDMGNPKPPGALFYQVDCGPQIPVGNVICLAGGRFYTVTFCKPGNDTNWYSIQSISGITGAGGIITRQDAQCADTLTVSGINPASVTWTVKSPNDQTLLRYLSSTTSMAPIFTPDQFTPPVIIYEVCGTISGTAECNGNPMTDCNDVTVTTLPAIIIAFDINLGDICANNIPVINAAVTPINLNYTYQWFSGSDGTGSILSTNPSWKPTAEGNYSLVVTETTSGIKCNSATYNFTIAFDVLGPTSIVAPPPLVVECNGPGATQQILDWLATATAFDGTESMPVTNNYTGIIMACSQPPLTVTFSASDQCGNISTATSTITVVDTQAPTWATTAGALDRTVDCSDAAGLATAQALSPVATDLCDPTLVLTKTSGALVAGTCPGTGTYLNTWTAKDDCNNVSALFAQTITVSDTEAPVITTQAQNQTVECDGSGNTAALNAWLANHGGAVATDACGGAIVWTNDNTPFSDLCGNTGVKTVTFTATDACGNSSTTTATFTITDSTAPTLQNVPADVSFECTDCIQSFLNGGFEENTEVNNWAYINEASVNGWETTSSTNRIEIQESGKVDGVPSYKGKYHAELNGDQVGDFYQQFCTIPTTYVQISFAHHKRMAAINTTDDIMGVYAGPSLSSLTLLGTYTATNTSGWKVQTVAFPVPAGQKSTVFLFRAIQGAPTNLTYGNLIDDITVTTLTSPSAIPSALDNCGDAAISIDEQRIDGSCPSNYQLIRTYTATDECGNSTSATQTVTVGDFKAPIWTTTPGSLNRTISCSDAAALALAQALAPAIKDSCDLTPTIVKTSGSFVPISCLHSGTYTNTWTATDDCNNTSVIYTQVISVVDNVAPVITCPPAATGITDTDKCFSQTVVLGTATATDNCSSGAQVPITNDAPAQFPVGITIVTWTATDACGNSSTCTQSVTVTDINQPPTISCPADVEQTALPGNCSLSNVVIPNPVTADNCAVTLLTWTMTGATTRNSPAIGINYVSGETFNVGNTLVTYTAADPSGNTATCSFNVRIKDLNKPVFAVGCPADVSKVADPGLCTAAITVPVPAVTDPCNEGYTLINSFNNTDNASGNYPVGITIVTWTITDNSLNVTTCTQTITVTDLPPTISCPGNVSETIAADQCTKTGVVVGTPSFGDNCPNPVLTYVLSGATTGSGTGVVPAAQAYGVGVTTVTYTVTDSNNTTVTCSFTVTIQRLNIPPAVITCPVSPAAVTAVAGTCFAPVTVAAPVEVDPCATATYTFVNSFNSTADASGSYPVGTTTVTWTITDNSGNITTCTQTVVVNDLPPTISCPGNVSETIAADQCTKTGVVVGTPTYGDNCPNPVLTYVLSGATTGSGTGVVPAAQAYGVGVTTVTYTVTDSNNTTVTCSFTVTIQRLNIPPAVITCPVSPAAVTAVAGTCFAPVTVAAPVEVDPCATATYTFVNSFNSTADASGSYPVGSTTVTWTITDNSGNITTCTQTVVVNDLPPTISCPGNVSETIAADQCTKTGVVVGTPTFGDNCPNPVLTYTLSGATTGSGTGVVPAAQAYGVGVTTVTYTVTDSNNTTVTCSFTVTIQRLNIPPAVITCPVSPAAVTAVAGTCFAPVTVAAPVEVDPCATATYTFVNSFNSTADASGSYPVGTTTVTWTITDNSGNITTCTQTVVVTDLLPSLSCPSNIVVDADYELPYKDIVPVPEPTYSDNCPNPVLTWVMVNPLGVTTSGSGDPSGKNVVPSPSRFLVGVSTITYTVTDSNGNTATCSFTVTVLGEPVITCLPPVTYNTDPGVCTATRNSSHYGLPTLVTGVQPITWTWTITDPDGVTVGATGTFIGSSGTPGPPSVPNYAFQQGISTILWRAENISGFATCTQTVTVEDKEDPTFTTQSLTACVDMLQSATYTTGTPNPNIGVNPNLIKSPSPDYYTFVKGRILLDLTNLKDNCCNLASLIINWRIDFTDVPDPTNPLGPKLIHPSISGTGQPSTYSSDIFMWGDGVTFTTVTHHITYWVEDCHGNVSDNQTSDINITPRPNIIKMNY